MGIEKWLQANKGDLFFHEMQCQPALCIGLWQVIARVQVVVVFLQVGLEFFYLLVVCLCLALYQVIPAKRVFPVIDLG